MFRKGFISLLTAALCVGAAGCASNDKSTTEAANASSEAVQESSAEEEKTQDAGNESSEASNDSSAADGTKDITKVAVGAERMAFYEEMAKKYEEENAGKKVELIEIVSGSDMYTKITMMMQSPQTCPDLITEDGFMINSDVAAGYLTPLDDFIKEWEDTAQFVPEILDGAKAADGKQYGIPFSTDTQGIWYNKKLMEKAGVTVPFEPKNWKEILDAAQKLKAIGGDGFIPLFLFASKTSPEETSMRTFQMLYSGTGAELYDNVANKWIVDKENLLKVFEFINQVYNVDKVGPPLSIASQQKVGDLFQSDYMKNDKLGMYFSGSWEAGNWGKGKQYEWPEGLDTWGFAKIPTMDGQAPGFTTMSGGWTWSIPANANNKDGGKDFLKFIANKESQLAFNLLSGDLAVRKDVMEDPTYTEQDMSVVNEAGEMLEYAHFRPSVEGYSKVTTMYTEVVESIAMASSTPEDAVTTFEAELKRIVGEQNVTVK